MTNALTTSNDEPDYGPKMRGLSPKRRAFVVALYDDDAPDKGNGLLIYAARAAGYGTGDSTNKVLSVIANRVVQQDSVKEAIAEYSRGIVRAISPEAVRAVRNLVRDKTHKDHARAAMAILDRVDPVETTHNVKVENRRSESNVSVAEVMKEIRKLAREAGVLIPEPKIIEGTCAPVEEAPQ